MEFPLAPFATALIYAAVGAADDRWAVVVPFASGVVTVGFAFLFGRRLFGSSTATVGALVLAVSPVFVRFTQLTFPEGPLLAASAGAMYWMLRWHQSGSKTSLLVGGLSASLAVLFKPTALVLGVPFAWLFWLRDGKKTLSNPWFYVFGAVVLIPPVLWYVHALQLALTYGNSFGILFGGGSNKMLRLDLLTSPEFYAKLAFRLSVYHLTLLGAVGALVALVRCRFTPLQRTVPIWAGATLFSFLVITMGNDETAYYQLPIVIPGSLLAGVGLVFLNQSIGVRVGTQYRRAASLCLVGLSAVGVAVGTVEHFTRSDYVWYTRPGKEAAQELATLLRPGALIVFSQDQSTAEKLPRGQHVTPPVPFYFSRHKGWYLATEWVTENEIRTLAYRGAEYFIVEDHTAFARAHPLLTAWLDANFRRVPASWVVWDLKEPACASENPAACSKTHDRLTSGAGSRSLNRSRRG
jgi:4-amino-4-deoxy-L-arabinose transferase-like glycosyltransferase